MSFYDRHLAPRLVHFACSMGAVTRQRARVVPQAAGTVVEFGVGSGLNLPHYERSRIERLIGVDPEDGWMARKAKKAAARTGLPLELVPVTAERVPLDSAIADDLVITFTLCTIPDPAAALGEALRLLKPGGRLLFLEHGLAPEESVQRRQARWDRWWPKIAGGCHLTRNVPQLLQTAGFRAERLEAEYLPGGWPAPRPLTFNYWGIARAA